MRVKARLLLLFVPLISLGCSSATDPFSLLSASGTITQGGMPATATITLSAGNFNASTDYSGSYSITVGGGGVPASACGTAAIRASLLASDGSVVDQETVVLGACGQHTVDFEFP